MPSLKILKLDPKAPQPEKIAEAASIIENGGFVIFPTETVYGIAANFTDKKAIDRLYEIKNRPKEKNFSFHIARTDSIEEFASGISVLAYKIIDRFWPGPLTIVLKGKHSATVGFRMPDNEIALELLRHSRAPIVAPSANLSGNPAPKNFQDAIKDFESKVDMALDGGDCRIGLESTVVDLSGNGFKILREGAIKKEELQNAASQKTVLFVCTGNTCRSAMAEYLFKKTLAEQNKDNAGIFSAGISTVGGIPISASALNLLKQEGIDASGHRSKEVSDYLLKKSDLILVMERSHEAEIIRRLPDIKNRVYLLKDFARIKDSSPDIGDPVGLSLEFYKDVFYTIKDAVKKVAQII